MEAAFGEVGLEEVEDVGGGDVDGSVVHDDGLLLYLSYCICVWFVRSKSRREQINLN